MTATVRPWAAAVCGGLVAALCGLVLAFADPFARLDLPAIEGRGLTPILEHPAMLYHPPLLYLGLVTLAAPFAVTVGALATDVPPTEWTGMVRRWLVVPWTLLAVGMVAGAHWAYVELGWGGYWAWDPVENTALLPWLAVTLALHASLRGPSRGFAALVCLAFVLALAGTMLTRSGAVPSVHAFGEDVAIGRGLAAVLAVVVVGSAVLLLRAKPVLLPGSRTDVGFGWLVTGHLAVVGAVLGIAVIGTGAPLVSELAAGDDVAIEGRYFAQFAGPLATVGLGLVALVPALRAPRRIAFAVVGMVVGIGALAVGDGDLDLPRLVLGAVAGIAVVTAVGGALVTSGRVAPHLAHAGIGVVLLGVAGTATGRTETVSLQPGESVFVQGEVILYDGVTTTDDTVTAEVRTSSGTLSPSLVAYPERRQILAETSLVSTPLRDLQVALRSAADDGTATLQVGVYPLQVLVWWGALVVVGAGVLMGVGPRARITTCAGVTDSETDGDRSCSSRSSSVRSP